MNNEEKRDGRPEAEHERQHEHEGEHHFEIQIDRTHYTVKMKHMTGLQLRHVPTPPIGPERDLFEVVPGGSDRKIGNEQVVEIRNGLRFFTAPAQINPGADENDPEDLHVAAN
jgi:hypothetical protein